MTNDLIDKNVNHYKSLMGYVVLTVGIHPENPHDVRLVMAKRNPDSGETSYIEVRPASSDEEDSDPGFLHITNAKLEPVKEKENE
jgi:hypothetical protein